MPLPIAVQKHSPSQNVTAAGDWAVLKACPIFRHLDDATLRRVVARVTIQSYARGKTVFSQGDPGDAFFVVVDGWVKLSRFTTNGDEAVFSVIARGESFAEPIMFMGGRYPVNAIAATDCRLARMEHDSFVRSLESERDLAPAMLASIAKWTAALTEEIGALKVLDAPSRVAEFLLRFSTGAECSAQVPLPFEKALIAARLGMTPESFSRALAVLRSVGVTTKRDTVIIESIPRLRQFVAGD